MENAPPWFEWALSEIGTREEPENRGAAIRRYIALARAGHEGDPWCAIFACAAFEACGLPSPRSAGSQSFRSHPEFVQLARPGLGAVVVFWRNTPHCGLGHVGFYRGESKRYIYTLGGNEGDMVQIEALAKSAPRFGLVGYYWPKSFARPTLGAIAMDGNVPAHQVSVT